GRAAPGGDRARAGAHRLVAPGWLGAVDGRARDAGDRGRLGRRSRAAPRRGAHAGQAARGPLRSAGDRGVSGGTVRGRRTQGGNSMTLWLESIVAGYGRVQVLHDVSVHIGPGEIIALIGPNGAGKSTLLRAASGMIPPTSGQIRLGDKDLTGDPSETVARA